ncbi:hypothetical protein [Aquirufa sp. TARAVU-A1A]
MYHSIKWIGAFMLISLTAIGQQNFFNVPSSDITPRKKVFFQQQLNFIPNGVQSGSTFCYGLGHNTEIGFNVLGVNYDYQQKFVANHTEQPYNPFFTLNAQKSFQLHEDFKIGLGAQAGFTQVGQGGTYLYGNGVYVNEHTHTKWVSGLYYTTDNYFGPESRNFTDEGALKSLGIQLGVEQNIWEERLLFQADFISGKHSLGEVVIGGAYYVSKHWVLSAGIQIPTFNSQSQPASVFELTFVP